MKFWWKGKAHRTAETEANRFGLRFLYFAAGRENNQLEHSSDDRIATPPTKQGFLEFKESKTRLLHTMLAPAPDGAFSPVPRVVAVGRPRRARAYGEQTGRHGKGKKRDSSFRFIVSSFLLKIYFCGSPQLDHKVKFAPDRGISLLIIPKTPKESNMLAAHHLPEIPRS